MSSIILKMTSSDIIQKLWCNVLCANGMSHGDYVEQLSRHQEIVDDLEQFRELVSDLGGAGGTVVSECERR